MEERSNIKAVIFDKDGVITDNFRLYYDIIKEILSEHNIPINFEHFYKECVEDMKSPYKVYIKNNEISYTEYDEKKKEIFHKILDPQAIAFSGVVDKIKELSNIYTLGLASNNHDYVILKELKELKIEKYFKTIVTGNDISRSKPDPEIYLKAVKNLNLTPSQCIAIEDSESGLKSAKSAGLKCIIIKNKYNSHLQYPLADKIISSFDELNIETINKIGGMNG